MGPTAFFQMAGQEFRTASARVEDEYLEQVSRMIRYQE